MIYKGSIVKGSGGGSGNVDWGDIGGTLSDQTDLQTALNAKQDTLTAGSGIDITNNVISATISGLTNTATGTNSLTILGTATTAANATNIGVTSGVTGNYSTALGYGAGVTSGATRAIQIGEGTNSVSNTFSVGFGVNNYQLLNGSTGKIPNDRLNAFTGATSSVAGSVGAVPAPTTSDVNKYLKGDGTWAEAGGSVSFDGSTINENASNELQAIGFIDKNSGSALGFWHGTEAQYNVGGTVKDLYYDWEYSTENWTAGTLPNAQTQNSIATGNGVTISFGFSAKISIDDGESWSVIYNTGLAESGYQGVVGFGNNRFVIYPGNATTGAYTIDNGQTWNTMPIVNAGLQLYGIAYGNGIWLVTSDTKIICSQDEGLTWIDVTPSGESNFRDVTFGNGKFIVNSNTVGKAYVTTTGTSFITINLPYAKQYIYSAFGNGEFVLVSNGSDLGTCIHSADLENWEAEAHPVTWSAPRIIFGQGLFVIYESAGGYSHNYHYTKNLKSWITAAEPSPINYINLFGVTTNKFIITSYYDGANFVYGDIAFNSVYTLEAEPTTASTVYSAPAVASALTITSVGTGTITLSDTNTYTYNAGGNAYSYYTVGESYPNYVCNIDGIGVKIGLTDIANLATYSAFGGATGSVAGSSGLVPAPTATDNDKYLKGDGTWSAVSGLQNVATGNESLSILETTTGGGSVNIGTMDDPSTSNNHDAGVSIGIGTYTGGDCDVVVGNSARTYGAFSVAIGNSAYCWQSNSIQIGCGENNEAKTFCVGFFDSNPDLRYNYKLLDGATGKIPNDRIDGATGSFTSQDGKTVTVTNGVITSIV